MPRTRPSLRPALLPAWLAPAILLASCTVGPEHHTPDNATPAAWNQPSPDDPASASQPSATIAESADLSSYWALLGDPDLDALVRSAQIQNLDLQLATLRIAQAREARTITASGLYPNVNSSASASRNRVSGRTGNTFRAGFDASWEIDVFGGTRRAVEAAEADIQFTIEDRRDILVTLTGEVASTYFELRAAQQQLRIALSNIDTQRQTLTLTRQRFDAGFVSRLDVVNAESQVLSTEARVPGIRSAITQNIYILDILLGRRPGTLLPELSADKDLVALPPAIPIGLPSDLLERRPDIRRADASLHAAIARVGVATADLYPRFSLSAALGLQSGSLESFGSIANRFWSLGGAISWPVYQAGAIRANIAAQQAVADQALITYRSTVLLALQETESSLVTYRNEQIRHATLQDNVRVSRDAVVLARDLYENGQTDFLNVLNTQRSVLDAESSLLDSRRALLINLVSLFKALGGGWDPAEPDARPASTTSTPPPARP